MKIYIVMCDANDDYTFVVDYSTWVVGCFKDEQVCKDFVDQLNQLGRGN